MLARRAEADEALIAASAAEDVKLIACAIAIEAHADHGSLGAVPLHSINMTCNELMYA
jgi:hypothetical protein